MANTYRECSVCKACGCGTALYDINGKLYCNAHIPKVSNAAQDAQVLTPEQKLNIANGTLQPY